MEKQKSISSFGVIGDSEKIKTLNEFCKEESNRGFSTGIKSLDKVIRGGIICGTIFEVIGQAASGKTKLVESIALNLLINHDDIRVMYIDTKKNLSALALLVNLQALGIPEDVINSILRRITVEEVSDLEQLNKVLTYTLEKIKENHIHQLVIIDSIPPLFYLWSFPKDDFYDYQLGMKELSKSVSLLRKLNAANITVITTNLLTRSYEDFMVDDAEVLEENDVVNCSETTPVILKPACGKFWASVPTLRVAITGLDEIDDFSSEVGVLYRKLQVVKASVFSNIEVEYVQISDVGITSCDESVEQLREMAKKNQEIIQ